MAAPGGAAGPDVCLCVRIPPHTASAAAAAAAQPQKHPVLVFVAPDASVKHIVTAAYAGQPPVSAWLGLRDTPGSDCIKIASATATQLRAHIEGTPSATLEVVVPVPPCPPARAPARAGRAAAAVPAATQAPPAPAPPAGDAGGGGASGGGSRAPQDNAAKRKRHDKASPAASLGDGAGPSAPPLAPPLPAPAAAGSAAAPPGFFTIKRTGATRYVTCAALEAALQPRDTVHLSGGVQGPLQLRVSGVQLRGTQHSVSGAPPELYAVEQGSSYEVPTLTVGAHKVCVKGVRLWTPRAVEENMMRFSMSVCEVVGHGREEGFVQQYLNYGHSGVRLCAGVRNARLEDVRICNLSGDGVEAHDGATAELISVRIERVAGNGVFINAAGACVLQRVQTLECGLQGIYCDAAAVCEFVSCSARKCGHGGFVFDVPTSALNGVIPHSLLTTPHFTRDLLSSENGGAGVQLLNGAAADLFGARIEDNALNGVYVKYCAPRAGATARTSLAGAKLLRNGCAPGVDKQLAEHAAVAVERLAGGPSMLAVLDATGVTMKGNGVDQVLEVLI